MNPKQTTSLIEKLTALNKRQQNLEINFREFLIIERQICTERLAEIEDLFANRTKMGKARYERWARPAE
tara:strand:- start:113 stop:319 length:207 start_codon:yes stop_codon:yes gene_type:complete